MADFVKSVEGGGKIEGDGRSFTVTAPNGQPFTGAFLCDSKLALEGWWIENGGREFVQDFRSQLGQAIKNQTPHRC